MAQSNLVDNKSYSYLNIGDFSDFEIQCQLHVFKVHRIVICQKSKYFAALNNNDWTVGYKR